jgi:hypothetical protein
MKSSRAGITNPTDIGTKVGGIDFNGYGTPGYKAQAFNTTAEKRMREELKNTGGDWFNAASLDSDGQQSVSRRSGSKSPARKAASAMIAKIPLVLSRHIAKAWYPDSC